ncbi:Uu.00g047700.m01.CDS01 [Anthostomella pinea]|uniref:Uu.00g047700.m01.CDS01 n=1 Tax=Anthostomella pinea TaxID=933095 RepID=A0AAI8YEM5_9PEZI|nr:Uu.00g047700.m01.CDS01 [Anthostomella pinea]
MTQDELRIQKNERKVDMGQGGWYVEWPTPKGLIRQEVPRYGIHDRTMAYPQVAMALLTNRISINQPGQSVALGTALDVVGSVMNHSCNPNVCLFFEGKELRVRSLRTIEPGEEIMHCYTDVQCDVLLRQRRLEEDYFFVCSCQRCCQELETHRLRTSDDNDSLEEIRKKQDELFTLMNNVVVEASASLGSVDVGSQLTAARSLADAAFQEGQWPDDLEPMPSLLKTLGRIWQAQGQPLEGIKSSLRGSGNATYRLGPRWCDDLFELIQVFTRVVVLQTDSPAFEDMTFPRSAELWDLFHGYLHELCLLAESVYGLDTCYARAIRSWHDNTLEFAEDPLPGTPEFQRRFRASHAKLLTWAGVDSGRWIVDQG